MARKYDMHLVDLLKQREVKSSYKGLEVTIKRLPDLDEDGAMDPRLYEDSKEMIKAMELVPASALKMDASKEGLANLRESFNGIKSVPVVESKINIQEHRVETEPGVFCNVYQYTDEYTKPTDPVLYYIHGGGFFAGHHGVVEESLKLFCEKFHFPIFSVDYCLAPEHPYPSGHEDVYAVLKWIYKNGKELKIDPEKIFVAGDSAGGNLAQYCSTKDRDDHEHKVKGQMLLYPTLNMCGIEDEFFKWDISFYDMIPSQKNALSKMINMFGQMSSGLTSLLNIADAHDDYLNPYSMKDVQHMPATFVTVGEHDYLKVETLAWGAKLHANHVPVRAMIYNGLGHAYFDNCGVYPQCEDCIEEMGQLC